MQNTKNLPSFTHHTKLSLPQLWILPSQKFIFYNKYKDSIMGRTCHKYYYKYHIPDHLQLQILWSYCRPSPPSQILVPAPHWCSHSPLELPYETTHADHWSLPIPHLSQQKHGPTSNPLVLPLPTRIPLKIVLMVTVNTHHKWCCL